MLGEQEDKPQTGKKIFANDTSDKELLFKIYKELLKFNNKKTKNTIENGQKKKKMNKHLTKENIQMV